MPYGYGFDDIIKSRTASQEHQKYHNNRIMDDLVTKLGYLDYRDMLACNKYILEAKRHGSYHQQARAQVLHASMQRFNNQKRNEIN